MGVMFKQAVNYAQFYQNTNQASNDFKWAVLACK